MDSSLGGTDLKIDFYPSKNSIRAGSVPVPTAILDSNAAIQSLLATAKVNGIEPYAWLKDTLEKLPAWPYSRIDELLPIAARESIRPVNVGP